VNGDGEELHQTGELLEHLLRVILHELIVWQTLEETVIVADKDLAIDILNS